jgi:phosphonate transport system permease protein
VTPVRPPIPWRGWLAALLVALVLAWSAQGTGFSLSALADGLPQIGAFFGKLLPSAQRPWPTDDLPRIAEKLLETLRIALAASILGAALALPFTLAGARTLAPGRLVYGLGRGFLNLIRTIPDLVLATLLATALGIGPVAGFFALLFFSFGVVAKLLCDTAETIDPGPMEAVAAAGGTRLEQAVFAALPQLAPDFAAYTLYSFEINIRAATVLGLVGAGGIGMILQTATTLMNYARVGLIIALTFAVVFLIDSLSAWVRSRLV